MVVRLKPDLQKLACRQGIGLAIIRLKPDLHEFVVGKAMALRLSG